MVLNPHTTRSRRSAAEPHASAAGSDLRLTPLARAVAVALAALGALGPAHAAQAFSPAWFANKGAAQAGAAQTGRLPNGMPASSLTSPS